jgi:glycosyltransferase involved in cell wall biosynthesis
VLELECELAPDQEAPRGERGPSILAVTSQLPWPLNTGGHLRTFHLLRGLAREFHVRLVTRVTAGQERELAGLERCGIGVCPTWVGGRSGWRQFLRVAGSALRGEPYVLYGRHYHRGMDTVIDEELERQPPDLLYLDHLDATLFARTGRGPAILVDLHNVYSKLVRRTAEELRWPLRMYLRREARLLERAELRAARLADVLFAVSDEEAAYFRGLGAPNVRVVPNGVDCQAYEHISAAQRSGAPLLLYVGAMSWSPNVRAACTLAREVLPQVRARFPAARLRIVGRDPLPQVRELGHLPGVEVTGTVPSIVPHLAEAQVLAVPLESGGGTRLKILEAFAAGLPVVSTPVGCEGLGVRDGEHLLIADLDRFAERMLCLLADPALANALAQRARFLARKQYDWGSIGTAAREAIRSALAGRN